MKVHILTVPVMPENDVIGKLIRTGYNIDSHPEFKKPGDKIPESMLPRNFQEPAR
jgi:hypothetical protein